MPVRLEPAEDPERHRQAAIAATAFTIDRAKRFAEEQLMPKAFEPPGPDELTHAPEGDDLVSNLVQMPDPVLFLRATRDALTAFLDDMAEQIGGPTETTPVGWPWKTWPT